MRFIFILPPPPTPEYPVGVDSSDGPLPLALMVPDPVRMSVDTWTDPPLAPPSKPFVFPKNPDTSMIP